MPHGCMLCRIRLSSLKGARGSGADLSTYFYQLMEAPGSVPRRAFGRRITGGDAAALGLDSTKFWRLALLVLAMGGRNSAAIAQEVHEEVLRRGEAVFESEVLRYGLALPSGDLFIGAYLNDLGVVYICGLAIIHSDHGPDPDRTNKAHASYEKHGLPVALDKGFGFARRAAQPGGQDVAGASAPAPSADTEFTLRGTRM